MSVPEEGYSKNAARYLHLCSLIISWCILSKLWVLFYLKQYQFCFLITEIVDIMKRKCKQYWSTVPLISIKNCFDPSQASTWFSNVISPGLYCIWWF